MSARIAYDVVIAGAGPAGCAAAIKLRQLGLTVALVDQVEEGRLKIGESLPSAAIRLLHSLGINGLHELLTTSEYTSCTANVSAWGSDQWIYRAAILNPEGGGWHLLRHRFDSELRRLAKERGVDFYSAKIGTITTTKDTVLTHHLQFKRFSPNLPEKLVAKWVIDATGRAAVLLRQLGVKRITYSQQMAAVCWIETPDSDQDHTTRIKSVEGGWWYTAQLPAHQRVIAFHGTAHKIANMVKQPEYFLTTLKESHLLPYLVTQKGFVKGYKISATHANVTQANQLVGANWLAVGDAALSFDPLSSQGIFFALYSGIRGAETIATLLEKPTLNEQVKQQYSNKVDAVFQANERSRRYYYSFLKVLKF